MNVLSAASQGARLSRMPRAPRDAAPGFHHVWVNATGNELYYRDDVDRMAWIRLLVKLCARRGWRCLAFCQLTTHVHLLVEVPDWSLPLGMQWLNAQHSRDLNDRHGRVGQFVRGRYGSRRVASAKDLVGVYVYVVLNPVEAGMCRRPEDWRWSSYASAIGLCDDFPFVDPSAVIAEAGGSAAALQASVDAELDARLYRTAMSGL